MKKENVAFQNNQFIVLFMKILDLKVNDMVKFLEVSANTVYNYRTLDENSIPLKITQKLFDILNVSNVNEAKELLINLDFDQKNMILGKLSKSITAKTMLLNEMEGKSRNQSINEFSKLGSKVFIDALIHEIENVVTDVNDYEFIVYIREYKKGE